MNVCSFKRSDVSLTQASKSFDLTVKIFASTLSSIGLQYKDLMLSSHSMIIAKVHLANDDVIMSADGMSCGAMDFFADSPFTIHGSSLRILVWRGGMPMHMHERDMGESEVKPV